MSRMQENTITVQPTFSVITVVYNAVTSLEKTIQSVIAQTCKSIEYIVIDGGSTDGSVDVIKKYQDNIDYWISEKDTGIYDAMNKGIDKCTGKFTVFLNSGDHFPSETLFEDILNNHAKALDEYPLIYGRAKILKKDGALFDLTFPHSHDELWRGPAFRHGALLCNTALLQKERFILSKELRIAADYEFIYRCYKNGYQFYPIDQVILAFQEEGVSDNPYTHLKDSIYILKKHKDWNLKARLFYAYKYTRVVLSRTIFRKIFLLFKIFFQDYFANNWINKVPFYFIRHQYYKRVLGIHMGKGTSIHMNCFLCGTNITIAENTTINRKCFLDGRGQLSIGNKVSISPEVQIITGDHDYNSPSFAFRSQDVRIDDYVWVGTRAMILPGVHIGEGAVVCAGAVVTKDVEAFAVVAGIPAKKIKERSRNLDYNPSWFAYFD
ncbi:glycosyltransferase [Chitinophaga flava]|uniref:Glycosyltransferase 2-like domain-containing protein n=1 Tax=Chitinophaga flava TaxID=2259036 RepID=A0A365Y5F1_9BACT|nr:glycosyltransferase [Chitinophaga flava]RBL93803.1 hypothetical protein DF182_15010 [Chitinophaga flava]